MDTIYNTYTRFLDAAKKFPRWNNTRRRPTTSNGGKLLRSIIEEIGKVEDAIIEYKKQFFIVNYIGKEDTVIDYLYAAFVGKIEDFNSFKLLNCDFKITEDKEKFYEELDNYAYYQDGYIVTKNNVGTSDLIKYEYNRFEYSAAIERISIWNIFDEWALWVGLERYDGETNAELMRRTVNVFRYKPNSTETGIKNIIYNAVSNVGNISPDEIKIEQPNEFNMALKNSAGETLYEEISKFNRDIARTKKWDVDEWEYNFRSLGYLPHVWDAPVTNYKNGVGYNDSLKTDVVKNLDVEGKTDVIIKGYKKSKTKVEQYVRKNKLEKELELELKRYTDDINPISLQYKITASNLTHVKFPKEVCINTYETSNIRATYHLQDFALESKNISVVENNKLSSNKRYRLKLFPAGKAFSCSKCLLKHSSGEINLMNTASSGFIVKNNKLVSSNQKFYGDQVSDFNTNQGFVDSENGFSLDNNYNGTVTLNTAGMLALTTDLHINYNCDSYNIEKIKDYISTVNFNYSEDKGFTSTSGTDNESKLAIEFEGNYCSFKMPKVTGSMKAASATVSVYVNDEYSNTYSPGLVRLDSKDFDFELLTDDYSKIRIDIQRTSTIPVTIKDICIKRYKINITYNGKVVPLTSYNYARLPRNVEQSQTLSINIINYGKTKFEVENVIIGSELTDSNSICEIIVDTTNLKNASLVVEHNGDAKLYNENGEISYYNIYQNKTGDTQALYLDLSSFKNIRYSDPEIKYDNEGTAYIALANGSSISTIEITGKYEKLVTSTTLYDLVKPSSEESVYVNKKLEGIIVKNSSGGENFYQLTYDKLVNHVVNKIKIYSQREKNLEFCFVADNANNIRQITGEYEGLFDHIYVYDKNSKEYVAYNHEKITRKTTNGVSIVNSFLPVIPTNTEVLYYIEDVKSSSGYKFRVLFETGKQWAASMTKTIDITAEDINDNTELIDVEHKTLKKNFSISNNIALNDTYEIGGKNVEIAKFIVCVPEGMKLNTKAVKHTQYTYDDGTYLFVENDGYNKLAYSNITSIESIKINGISISSDDYTLMDEEGIICWNNDKYYGDRFIVTYTYDKPVSLSYNSADFLYDFVGYQIDALANVNKAEYIVKNLSAGETFKLDTDYFSTIPDKVSLICSNDCYTANYNNGYITINKIADDNSIAVHNGYYYLYGKEYWYFSDKCQHDIERTNGIYLYNVVKSADNLVLHREAVNMLKNSRMIRNTLGVHAIFDFNYYRTIPNVSSLDHIGACNSLAQWKLHKMSADLSDAYDGDSIAFKDEGKGYAILDITHALHKNKFISCKFIGNLSFALGREVFILGQALSKSLYIEHVNNFSKYSTYAYFDGKDLEIDKYRYYLIVTGSGTLIEAMTTDSIKYAGEYDFLADHEKAISKFGLNISEKQNAGEKIEVEYSPIGNVYYGLESDKDLWLATGASADWGITKIKDFDLAKDIKTIYFRLRKDYLTATADNATVETRPIKLDFKVATEALVLKINDYPVGKLKNFNIKALGSVTENGTYNEIELARQANTIAIPSGKLMNYVKFEIKADEGQEITHIEAFVQYKETQNSTVKIVNNLNGSVITKIFDLGSADNYMLEKIVKKDFAGENISFYIRGLRSNNDNTYTEWYNVKDNHVFNNYRYFQIKINIDDPASKVKIEKFMFKVVG